MATRELADASCQQSEQRVERLFYSLWHNADSAPRTPWRKTCSAAVTPGWRRVRRPVRRGRWCRTDAAPAVPSGPLRVPESPPATRGRANLTGGPGNPSRCSWAPGYLPPRHGDYPRRQPR